MSGPKNFVMLQRSPEAEALLSDMTALHLLTVIGLRARYSDTPDPIHNLKFGQALVGDWDATGMSQRQYRNAKKRLAKYGFASFEGTSKGTVATLLGKRVFNLRDDRKDPKWGEREGEQKGEHSPEVKTEEGASDGASTGANEGRARGEQGATNNKEIRKHGLKRGEEAPAPSIEYPSFSLPDSDRAEIAAEMAMTADGVADAVSLYVADKGPWVKEDGPLSRDGLRIWLRKTPTGKETRAKHTANKQPVGASAPQDWEAFVDDQYADGYREGRTWAQIPTDNQKRIREDITKARATGWKPPARYDNAA